MNTAKLLTILTERCGLKQRDKVIVGVSSGPDSVALLHLLHNSKLDLRLTIVYVDHGLRPDEVENEKKLIKRMANLFDISSEIFTIDAAAHKKKNRSSLEESCRILRYEVFARCKATYHANAVAVAHTADDQAEEILLRLFRGTGLTGLSGMRWRQNDIIRPLLETSKETLLTYLKKNHLPFCIDSSNSYRTFLRNRVRLDLIPAIKKNYNPLLTTTLMQTSDILHEDDDFIESYTTKEIGNCVVFKSGSQEKNLSASITTEYFSTLHKSLQRRIIEKVCWFFETQPTYAHIISLCRLAENGTSGSELHMGNGLRIYKSHTQLLFTQPYGKKPFRGSLQPSRIKPVLLEIGQQTTIAPLNKTINIKEIDTPPPLIEEGDLLIDAATITRPLVLRNHKEGEKFSPNGMQGRKTISKFLSDLKVTKPERINHPVITSDDKIVAVVGLRVDQHFAISHMTKKVLLITWHDSEES